MKQYVYLIDLKPDPELQEKYLEFHRNVWECVPQRLMEIGIVESAIYKRGERLVNVLTVEDSFNPETDFDKYTEDQACLEWDTLMRSFQYKIPGAKRGEWWALCERIY